MPYDLFWYGDPNLFLNYVEAYKKKNEDTYKATIDRMNFEAWLHGFYIDIALACNHPLAKKKHKYIDKPIDITEKDKEQHTEKTEEQIDKETQQAISVFYQFGQLANAMNRKRHENGE